MLYLTFIRFIGYQGPFLWVKHAWGMILITHPSPSAKVKNELKLYLLSSPPYPQAPAWRIVRQLNFTLLYFVRSKVEYAPVVWNSIKTADPNKLEHIQQKFEALCYNCFFPSVHYSYANTYLKFYTLCKITYHLDSLFIIYIYLGLKFYPSILDTISL